MGIRDVIGRVIRRRPPRPLPTTGHAEVLRRLDDQERRLAMLDLQVEARRKPG